VIVIIKSYRPGEPDSVAQTIEELDQRLNEIYQRHGVKPILVELSSDTFGAALVGMSDDYMTIELLNATEDVHARAIADDPVAVKHVIFSYAGQDTEVRAPYLVPLQKGRQAIRTWFRSGELSNDVHWATEDFPPKKQGKR
jgi:hypothetical protein